MGYNGIRTIIKPRRFSSFRKFFEEKKKGGLLRARGEREREVSGLIGLFAKSTRANTRRREREGNKPAERSVLILARKLRKTKEACRNSAPLDKSADRSSKRKRPVSTSKNLAITQQRLRQPSLQPTHRSARASPSYPPSRSVGGGAGSAWFPCGKPRKERRRRRRPTRRGGVFGESEVAEVEGPAAKRTGPFRRNAERAAVCRAGRGSLKHRIIAARFHAVPVRTSCIPERKGSSCFTPGPFTVYLKKKPRLSLETGGTLKARPLTFSANVARDEEEEALRRIESKDQPLSSKISEI